MRNCDIAKIAGISYATVYKILYLKSNTKYKFKPETVTKVKWLKQINSWLESKFQDKHFIILCDTILEKVTKRDSKKYEQLIELANCCKSLNKIRNHGIVREVYYNAYDIFMDADFAEMCRVAIINNRNGGMRELALELSSLSITFRKKLRL